MSLAEDQERLEAYVKWKAEREVTGNDTSPSAYVVDRAKQEAFERVEAAAKELENYDSLWRGHASEQAILLQQLYKILVGEE